MNSSVDVRVRYIRRRGFSYVADVRADSSRRYERIGLRCIFPVQRQTDALHFDAADATAIPGWRT